MIFVVAEQVVGKMVDVDIDDHGRSRFPSSFGRDSQRSADCASLLVSQLTSDDTTRLPGPCQHVRRCAKRPREQVRGMIHTDMPVTDPTPNLAPTARRILDAAIRVLDQHGFAGLTFERIAREAGENGALIRYHFGSKAGLVSALIDTVIYGEAQQLMAMLSPLQPGRGAPPSALPPPAPGRRRPSRLHKVLRIGPQPATRPRSAAQAA